MLVLSSCSTNIEVDSVSLRSPDINELENWDPVHESLVFTIDYDIKTKQKNPSVTVCASLGVEGVNSQILWSDEKSIEVGPNGATGSLEFTIEPIQCYARKLTLYITVPRDESGWWVKDAIDFYPRVFQTCNLEIEKYGGDLQVIRPGEELYISPWSNILSPYSYPLVVQVTSDGFPVNGVEVKFEPMNDRDNVEAIMSTTGRWGTVDGICVCNVRPCDDLDTHYVKASIEDPHSEVVFSFDVFNVEEEDSSNITYNGSTYTHQEYTSIERLNGEVKGDGILDYDDRKSLLVEVDYCSDFDYDTTEIESLVREIYSSADVEVEIRWDDSINDPTSNLSEDDLKRLLAEYRDNEGGGIGEVHGIIVNSYSNDPSWDTLGLTLSYDYDSYIIFWDIYFKQLYDIEYNRERLDSVGVVVFLDPIRYCYHQYMTTTQLIAFVLAHELGHALGMEHTDKWGANDVMNDTIPPLPFDEAGRFYPPSLHDSDTSYKHPGKKDGMNLRDILGRDNLIGSSTR